MNFLLSLIDKISREKQIMKLTMKCTPSTHTLKHLSIIIMVIPTKLPDPTIKEILPTSTFYYMFKIIGCPHNVENSIPLTNGFIWAIFVSQWFTIHSVVIVMDIVLKKYCLLIVSEFFDAYTWNMYALTYLTRRKLAMQESKLRYTESTMLSTARLERILFVTLAKVNWSISMFLLGVSWLRNWMNAIKWRFVSRHYNAIAWK